MFQWIFKTMARITGKANREAGALKDAERKEQERLKREAMLARGSRTNRAPVVPPQRSYPVQSRYIQTENSPVQQDNTALHLGMMAMAMSQPMPEPTKHVDSCSGSSYSDNSSSYDSGSSSSYDSGSSSCSSSFD
jgi:hypothetical protein